MNWELLELIGHKRWEKTKIRASFHFFRIKNINLEICVRSGLNSNVEAFRNQVGIIFPSGFVNIHSWEMQDANNNSNIILYYKPKWKSGRFRFICSSQLINELWMECFLFYNFLIIIHSLQCIHWCFLRFWRMEHERNIVFSFGKLN